MVYYRKYRPQTISELDLTSVRDKLTSILSAKELPHAFLFTGSKGLGKTSSARILAKAINCTQVSIPNSQLGIEPCNTCEVCISITNGSNIDVLEIDAASNGGVEEIRTLRERVKFASATLRKKVYIIDEVHMLSTGAFNALLKTLEEPPSHVVFVLATTELQKLPATIVSRTFQILFEKPTEEELTRVLTRIIKGEKLDISNNVLPEIYRLSDGSFRDAAKILEELYLNSNGQKITKGLFEKIYHTYGVESEISELLRSYAKRDAKMGLEAINRLSASGTDFKIVIEKLVDHLRGLLMMRNGIKSEVADISELTTTNIKDLLELANEAYGELKLSVIPQLPLELMTVKYCIIDNTIGNKNQESSIESEKKEDNLHLHAMDGKKNAVITSEAKQSNTDSANLLKNLIFEVNIVNKPGAALLRSGKSAQLRDDVLHIVTPFPVHAERLKSERVLPDISKAAEKIVGHKVEISIKTS